MGNNASKIVDWDYLVIGKHISREGSDCFWQLGSHLGRRHLSVPLIYKNNHVETEKENAAEQDSRTEIYLLET